MSSQLTRLILITITTITMATAVGSASAGEVHAIIKKDISADQITEMMKSLGLKWKLLEQTKSTMVAVSADDDNDVKIRDTLLKQSMVKQAYVVIATRAKVKVSGTVTHLDIEGGFWGVIGDDGEHYDLVNCQRNS